MNPSTEQPLPTQQPHRSSFSCDRHPSEHYIGFCPTCLCERLSTLDNKSSASSSSRRPSNATPNSSASAALKSIFRVSGAGAPDSSANGNGGIRGRSKASASFLPELRRTKSFSASKNERFPGIFEPQRKSCDVRTRGTLWNLFNQDDERKFTCRIDQPVEVVGSVNGLSVQESKEEEEEEEEEEEHEEIEDNSDGDEIRVSEAVEEIVSVVQEEVKTIKAHIDLDSQTKKPSGMDLKEIAGSFWAAASVFSKKWHKWRRKQKLKKRTADVSSVALPVEKPISRQFFETQSEIADYGFGRRSCDTDPRFSLDAGRMSIEDSRYSFDEPRASWDGHLIGRTCPRLHPMLSVVEDSPVVQVSRSDAQIPVEEALKESETVPGGSAQTREYYDSTSRRRKSLDRSSSIRKTAAAVIAEMDEMKATASSAVASNAKVAPSTVDYFPAAAGSGERREYREWDSETLEEKGGLKKSRRWMKALNIWGLFIPRRNKDEDRYGSRIGVERSFSASWPEMRREGNGESQSGFIRSNDSYNLGSFGIKKERC